MGSTLLGLGHCVPQRRVLNAELEERLGLEPGWIEQRTGIVERRWVSAGEALSDLAVAACAMALERSGLQAKDIALVILATSTPDHLLPPSGPLVAERLGLRNAGAIDMAGACSGFLYGLTFADAFARCHGRPVLIIAGNVLSRRINFADRDSAVLFADAAGAAVVAPAEDGRGVAGVELDADGSLYGLIQIPGGGSRKPFEDGMPAVETKMRLQNGRAVFRRAVEMMTSSARVALERAGCQIGDVNHWVPHQANARIVNAVKQQLDVGDAKTVSSVRMFGNSSAGTIPLTMSLNAERFSAGDTLLLTAAGAGLTGGAVVLRL